MKIKRVEDKGNTKRIHVSKTTAEFMNAIRRTVINLVPTLAVEEVVIYENDSVLFDEFLAHRIGLIPLTTDPKFKEGETLTLTLEKEGPCNVYSGDIKSKDPKIKAAFDNIPIVLLKKDQKIKLELIAVMNSGKSHVKFSPAVIAYNELPEIDSTTKASEKIAKLCPTGVLDYKYNKIVLKDPYNCILCGLCREEGKGEVKLTYKEDEFLLSIECFGQLDEKDVLSKAGELLAEKAEVFAKEIKKL